MNVSLIHTVLLWGGSATSVIAGLLWTKATEAKALSSDTSGWGALIGGMVVVPGPKNERLDLVGTLKKQSLWNAWAARATAVAAVLTGIAPLFHSS
jgi:hypothetical protein